MTKLEMDCTVMGGISPAVWQVMKNPVPDSMALLEESNVARLKVLDFLVVLGFLKPVTEKLTSEPAALLVVIFMVITPLLMVHCEKEVAP